MATTMTSLTPRCLISSSPSFPPSLSKAPSPLQSPSAIATTTATSSVSASSSSNQSKSPVPLPGPKTSQKPIGGERARELPSPSSEATEEKAVFRGFLFTGRANSNPIAPGVSRSRASNVPAKGLSSPSLASPVSLHDVISKRNFSRHVWRFPLVKDNYRVEVIEIKSQKEWVGKEDVGFSARFSFLEW